MKFILIALALITFVNGRKVTIPKDSGTNDVDTPKNNSSNAQLHDLDEDIPTRRILPINVHIANKPTGAKVKITGGVTVNPTIVKGEETIITRRLNNPPPSEYEEEEDEYNYLNEEANTEPLEQNNASETDKNPLGDLLKGFTEEKASSILTPLKQYLQPLFSSINLDSIVGSIKKVSGNLPSTSEEVITTRRLDFPSTEHIIEPEVVTYQINTDDSLNYIKLLTDKKNKERHYTETLKGTDYNVNNLTPELINHHHNILKLDPEYSNIKVYSYPYEMDSKTPIPIIKTSTEKKLYSYPYELNSNPVIPPIKSSHEKNYGNYYVSKYNQDIASNGLTDPDNSHSHSESYSYSMNGNGIDPPTYFSNYEVNSSPPNTNNEKPYTNYEDFDWDIEKEKKQYHNFLNNINYNGEPYTIPYHTSYKVNGKEVDFEKSNIPSKGHTVTIVRKKINQPVEVTIPKGAKVTGENALIYESKGNIYPLTRSFANSRRNFEYNKPSSKDSSHTKSHLPIEQPDTTDIPAPGTTLVEGAEVRVKPYPYPYQTDSVGNDYYYKHKNDGQTHRMSNKAYNNYATNTQYSPSHGANSQYIYNTHPYSMNIPYNGRGYNDWHYASPYAHHAQTYMPQDNMQINYSNI